MVKSFLLQVKVWLFLFFFFPQGVSNQVPKSVPFQAVQPLNHEEENSSREEFLMQAGLDLDLLPRLIKQISHPSKGSSSVYLECCSELGYFSW